tara:strand:- start:703 stop:879 length:177 start_codon:yes stop_codon:yes gene_type:complete
MLIKVESFFLPSLENKESIKNGEQAKSLINEISLCFIFSLEKQNLENEDINQNPIPPK